MPYAPGLRLPFRSSKRGAKLGPYGGCARPAAPIRCRGMTAAPTHPQQDDRRAPRVRVLVAFEDVRSVYRDIIARAVRALRPALEVRSAALAEIERELRRFDPHVVVCSRPNGEHPGGRGAWVHIPTGDGADDERLARVCLDGESWRTDDPPLAELLEVVDRTEERLREGSLTEAC